MGGGAFFKDFLRTLKKSITRFLSIVAITALGVGFYAGISATEPDMILSADLYYQNQNLADFSLLSPLGFRPEDVEQVRGLDGVLTVQETYFKDVFMTSASGTRFTVRLSSHEQSDTLNAPLVLEGRLPEQSGEIAIEKRSAEDLEIGSKLIVSVPNGESIEESLSNREYTIVGFIQSPLYISFERGQTNIGDGTIQAYALVRKPDFLFERVPMLYVRTSDSLALSAYTKAYEDHLAPLESQLIAMGKQVVSAETQSLRVELNEAKAELLKNKESAEQELAEANQTLLDAEQEINDGERELAEEEIRYEAELASQKKRLEEGRDAYYSGLLEYMSGYDLWLAGYLAWQDGRDDLFAAQAELDSAKLKLEQAEYDLESGKRQLDLAAEQIAVLDSTIVSLRQIRSSIPETSPSLSDEDFQRLLADIGQYSPELASYIETYYDPQSPEMMAQLRSFLDNTISQLEQTHQEAVVEYQAGLAEYNAGQKLLNTNKAKYEAGVAKIAPGLRELNRAKAELDSGKADLDRGRNQLDQAKVQLDEGDRALVRGRLTLNKKLEEARQDLANARLDLDNGRSEYDVNRAEALAELAKAEAEIRDAERQLVEIPQQWYVSTRAANPGYSGFGDDAGRIGAVAKVFPLFFFLVAALVCLTTMTRMVEEERSQIGTLKALGYSSTAIASKYLLYALLASIAGSAVGLFAGFRVLPATIMNAYSLMYQIPEYLTPIHPVKGLAAMGMALFATLAAAVAASLNELRSVPAVLMQPKAPKPGKRIFLEHIQPIWRRLSFSQKLAARNIFRYKQRLLMTVIGVAGCTALLLTGFGLKNSISAIVDKQFNEIFLYDGLVMINTEKAGASGQLEIILSERLELSSYVQIYSDSVSVSIEDSSQTHTATLMIPEKIDSFEQHFDLHERVSGNSLSLQTGGAVISEKLADALQVRPGDLITFRDSENRAYSIAVSGIMENYLIHYVFLAPDTFDRITYRTPDYNGAVFNFADDIEIDPSVFREELLANDVVLGSMLTKGLADDFSKSIGSLDLVVLVLIAAAGALAFVVLYNLISINITERIREIATIKVLGFRNREVTMYVFRENIVLTLLGTFAGLLLGVVLHRFVMDTMEIDNIMFGKTIHWASYIYSVLLTLLFSSLVNIVMQFRLTRIKMVESLKSVE